MNASQIYRQSWEVAINSWKNIRDFPNNNTVFNFLSKKTSNNVHSGYPQATLYVDCSNQQNTRSLVKLGDVTGMTLGAKQLRQQFRQCVRHKQVVHFWHVCLFIFIWFIFVFLGLFSQTDWVVMFSIGKYISLFLEYLWSAYFR